MAPADDVADRGGLLVRKHDHERNKNQHAHALPSTMPSISEMLAADALEAVLRGEPEAVETALEAPPRLPPPLLATSAPSSSAALGALSFGMASVSAFAAALMVLALGSWLRRRRRCLEPTPRFHAVVGTDPSILTPRPCRSAGEGADGDEDDGDEESASLIDGEGVHGPRATAQGKRHSEHCDEGTLHLRRSPSLAAQSPHGDAARCGEMVASSLAALLDPSAELTVEGSEAPGTVPGAIEPFVRPPPPTEVPERLVAPSASVAPTRALTELIGKHVGKEAAQTKRRQHDTRSPRDPQPRGQRRGVREDASAPRGACEDARELAAAAEVIERLQEQLKDEQIAKLESQLRLVQQEAATQQRVARQECQIANGRLPVDAPSARARAFASCNASGTVVLGAPPLMPSLATPPAFSLKSASTGQLAAHAAAPYHAPHRMLPRLPARPTAPRSRGTSTASSARSPRPLTPLYEEFAHHAGGGALSLKVLSGGEA